MTELTQPGDSLHNDLLTVVRHNYPTHALNVLTAFENYRSAHPGSETYHLGHFSVNLTPIYELTMQEVQLWDRLFQINDKLTQNIVGIRKNIWLPVTDIMSEFATAPEPYTSESFQPNENSSSTISSGLVQRKSSAIGYTQSHQLPLINLLNHVQIRAPIVKAVESDASEVTWYCKPSAFIDRSYGAAMYLKIFPLHRDGRPFLWSFHVDTVKPTNLGFISPVYVEFGFNTKQDPNSPNTITVPHEEPVLNGTGAEYIYSIESQIHDLNKGVILPQSDRAALAFYQMNQMLKKSALPEGPRLLGD